MDSPCIGTCRIHQQSRLCVGCRRSIDEITSWTAMTDAERSEIMREIAARPWPAGSPQPPPDAA